MDKGEENRSQENKWEKLFSKKHLNTFIYLYLWQ